MEVGGMRRLKKFMHDSEDTHTWLLTSTSSIALICWRGESEISI
jgi:hypothetical protein